MSKLDELIKKLCPDGVRFEELKNKKIFKFYYGKGNKIPEDNGGIYNVYGANGIVSHIDEYNCEDVSIIGHIGAVGMVNRCKEKCFVTYNGTIAEVVDKSKVNSQYLYYVLTTLNLPSYKKGSQPFLSVSDFDKIRIPVPPLEVQCEIVHILDDFTLLSAELSAELKARQKQYEYYRNEVLKCSDNKKLVKFGDVAKIQRGASPRPISQFITDDENGVNWIKIGDVEEGKKYITQCKEKITIEGSRKSRLVKKGDFILSNSMSFGRPYILSINGCIHDGWLSISDFQNYYLPDFLYHLLNSNDIQNMFKQKASFGGAVQNLNADIVRNIELPLISLEQQKKIIKVLDKFEIYCNNISEGLPAEIKARQKQYEYYRDKLLTFKELKVNE